MSIKTTAGAVIATWLPLNLEDINFILTKFNLIEKHASQYKIFLFK